MTFLSLHPLCLLKHYARLGSTMDKARELIARGDSRGGTIILTDEQIAGRGRYGRIWVSPLGNLYFSLILRPKCSLIEAAQISFVTAVAMGEVIGALLPNSLSFCYKWPNDILVEGRKLAGILLESEGQAKSLTDWLIIGVGVNVLSHPTGQNMLTTDLRELGIKNPEREKILQAFSFSFFEWLERWERTGFECVRQAWLKMACGIGESIRTSINTAKGNKEIVGKFIDIDAQGALIIELNKNEFYRVMAGEVFFQSHFHDDKMKQ